MRLRLTFRLADDVVDQSESSTEDDGSDDDDYGPPHPKGDDRFAGRMSSWPGGPDKYLVNYRSAIREYYRQTFPRYRDIIPVEQHVTSVEYLEVETLRQVRRKIQELTPELAEKAGITHREFSHWLVKQCGFPWRDDCELTDLLRLYAFVEDPATVERARTAPRLVSIEEQVRQSDEYWRSRGKRP